MKTLNIFKMNDWPIKKFFIFIISIQLAALGIFGLDFINYDIPILRQVIFFIYLIFVPGILILRILKVHNKDNIEILMYSIGLSISVLMFVGFFMNFLYPILDISNPISYTYLMITFSVVTLFLSIICYLRDRDYSGSNSISIRVVNLKYHLVLCFVPILSILGTYLLNSFNLNILNILLVIIIGIIVLLIGFDKISKDLYPFTVFIISISLLYLTSLISPYVWGNDIQVEYFFANSVYNSSFWNYLISNNVNATLSIVLFGPILSKMMDINLDWTFKIIYPLIYSLVPLGIYKISKSQTNDKIAFFTAFFFMATFSFYSEMLTLARQEIAELFFILIIMLIITNDTRKINKSILMIIFGISLIISHYSLSYIFVFMIGISILIYPLYKKLGNYSISVDNTNQVISLTLVLLFIIFTIAWYMYISNSSALDSLLNIFKNISNNLFQDFLDPNSTQSIGIILTKFQPMHQITKYLNIIAIFTISLGFITTIIGPKMKFKIEYIILSITAFVICILSIIIPNFSSQLQTSRLYFITLLVLAPFCIIGFLVAINYAKKIFKCQNSSTELSSKLISIFFVIFFLFNIGIIYEITGEKENSASLISFDKNFDFSTFNEQEIRGAQWLDQTTDKNKRIMRYADSYRWLALIKFDLRLNGYTMEVFRNNTALINNSYIYFGTLNIVNHEILLSNGSYVNSGDIITNTSEIYNNGGSILFFNNQFKTVITPS